MGMGNTARSVEEAVSLARDLLLSQAAGRLAPEQVLLGHLDAAPAAEDRHLLAISACLPSWCGVNSGEVFARVLVPRDPSDDNCLVEWAAGTA